MPSSADSPSVRTPFSPDTALALLVAATAVAWWIATDRLDLPKQVVLVAGTALAWFLVLLRSERIGVDWISAALLAAPVLVLAVAPGEASARVEGWAGWAAAVGVFLLARHGSVRRLALPLTALALGLAALAWLQTLGAPWFGLGISDNLKKRIVGTLGGPNHFGWFLAMLLPWAGTTLLSAKRLPGALGLILIAGALVLTGCRTAWVAAVLSLPTWIPWDRERGRQLVQWGVLGGALLFGGLTAVALDRVTRRTTLEQRATDLQDPRGTAQGRLYIWRVHLHDWRRHFGLGGGPESFARKWPAQQRSFLAAHPDTRGFRSDLRHAHADLVEVLVDFGVLGLVFGGWLLVRALRRREDEDTIRGPPLGSLTALGICGLTAFPLFFAPTLALGALCLGLRFGPPRLAAPRVLRYVPLVVLCVTLLPLGRRLGSEIHRSTATWLLRHQAPEVAYQSALRAVQWDERNPRAWIELASAQRRLRRWPNAVWSYERAMRDLPTDAILQRRQRLQRRMDRRGRPPRNRKSAR